MKNKFLFVVFFFLFGIITPNCFASGNAEQDAEFWGAVGGFVGSLIDDAIESGRSSSSSSSSSGDSGTITITMSGSTSGTLRFPAAGINETCWFASDTPVSRGSYTGQATYMATKTDSRTGGARKGIYMFGNIFIHEGSDPTWSQGCIVISYDSMQRLWNYIGLENQVRIVVN